MLGRAPLHLVGNSARRYLARRYAGGTEQSCALISSRYVVAFRLRTTLPDYQGIPRSTGIPWSALRSVLSRAGANHRQH